MLFCFIIKNKTKQKNAGRGEGDQAKTQQQQKIQPTTSELHIGFESREMDFCFH